MNGLGDVSKRGDVERGAGELSCVVKQALHLLLGSAIPQLQVIEHGEVLHGEPTVGILNGFQARTHLVGVVGHVGDGLIRCRSCGSRISSEGAYQTG